MAAESNKNSKSPAKTTKSVSKRTNKKSPATKKPTRGKAKAPVKAKAPAKAKAESAPTTKSPLDSPEFKPIVRDLIRLAKEQEYLTFDDINEALPDTQSDLELMEELIERLRGMKFRIIDSAEVDNLKAGSDDDDDATEAPPKKAAERGATRYPR